MITEEEIRRVLQCDGRTFECTLKSNCFAAVCQQDSSVWLHMYSVSQRRSLINGIRDHAENNDFQVSEIGLLKKTEGKRLDYFQAIISGSKRYRVEKILRFLNEVSGSANVRFRRVRIHNLASLTIRVPL